MYSSRSNSCKQGLVDNILNNTILLAQFVGYTLGVHLGVSLLSQFVASLGLENMGLTLMSYLLFQYSDTLGKE